MAASKDTMDAIHEALAKQLLEAIQSGEANGALLNVARQFLKDNGIDAMATAGSPLKALEDSLPAFDEDDPDNVVQFGRL